MQNRYLEILELSPGASKQEVKNAYRRLAKKYHPDISKDPNAQEKFVEIAEAYNFLTKVGPRPHNEQTSYNYNPEVSEYDRWRQQARAKAKARAREEIKMQQQMIKQMLRSFSYIAFVIISFNALLTIDYIIPHKEKEQQIIKNTTRRETNSRYTSRGGHVYDDIQFQEVKMRVIKNPQLKINKFKTAWVESTIIFNIPIAARFKVNQKTIKMYQAYSIYSVFGYIIPAMFLLTFFYLKVMKTLDQKLTIAIFICVIFIIQLFVFSLF